MTDSSAVAHFETSVGNFSIELYNQHAPKTCFNFIELIKMGYYEDVIFHRIIRDFVSCSILILFFFSNIYKVPNLITAR